MQRVMNHLKKKKKKKKGIATSVYFLQFFLKETIQVHDCSRIIMIKAVGWDITYHSKKINFCKKYFS